MLMVHSRVAIRFRSVSLALEKPPAKPTVKIGGSWLTTLKYEKGARFVEVPIWVER